MKRRGYFALVLSVLSFVAVLIKGYERETRGQAPKIAAERARGDSLQAILDTLAPRVDTVVVTAAKLAGEYRAARDSYALLPVNTDSIASVRTKLVAAEMALSLADEALAAYEGVVRKQAVVIALQAERIVSLERENAAIREALPTKGSVAKSRVRWVAAGLVAGAAVATVVR